MTSQVGVHVQKVLATMTSDASTCSERVFSRLTKPVWRHTLLQFESVSVDDATLGARGTIAFSPSSVLWGNGERAFLLTENTVHSGEDRLSQNEALLVYVPLVLEALLN